MIERSFPHLGGMHQVEAFQDYLQQLQISLPCDRELLSAPASPLAQPFHADGIHLGNRFAIQPMEGWDGTADGRPTEHTLRRWRRFGASGAKLIWGGEAVAVSHAGRANPNQLTIGPDSVADLAGLRAALFEEHVRATGSDDGLVIGLQLTHSGRYSCPNAKGRPEPRVAYRHPILDRRVGVDSDA